MTSLQASKEKRALRRNRTSPGCATALFPRVQEENHTKKKEHHSNKWTIKCYPTTFNHLGASLSFLDPKMVSFLLVFLSNCKQQDALKKTRSQPCPGVSAGGWRLQLLLLFVQVLGCQGNQRPSLPFAFSPPGKRKDICPVVIDSLSNQQGTTKNYS